VPFTLVHAGKYMTEDKLKIQTVLKLNTAKQKYHSLLACYDIHPGNDAAT